MVNFNIFIAQCCNFVTTFTRMIFRYSLLFCVSRIKTLVVKRMSQIILRRWRTLLVAFHKCSVYARLLVLPKWLLLCFLIFPNYIVPSASVARSTVCRVLMTRHAKLTSLFVPHYYEIMRFSQLSR